MMFGGTVSQVHYFGSCIDGMLGPWSVEEREVIQTWPGQYPFQDQGNQGPQAPLDFSAQNRQCFP
jgi:hypothetical protein